MTYLPIGSGRLPDRRLLVLGKQMYGRAPFDLRSPAEDEQHGRASSRAAHDIDKGKGTTPTALTMRVRRWTRMRCPASKLLSNEHH